MHSPQHRAAVIQPTTLPDGHKCPEHLYCCAQLPVCTQITAVSRINSSSSSSSRLWHDVCLSSVVSLSSSIKDKSIMRSYAYDYRRIPLRIVSPRLSISQPPRSKRTQYIERSLTLSGSVVSNGYTSKCSAPYWSKPPFLMFWHSGTLTSLALRTEWSLTKMQSL